MLTNNNEYQSWQPADKCFAIAQSHGNLRLGLC